MFGESHVSWKAGMVAASVIVVVVEIVSAEGAVGFQSEAVLYLYERLEMVGEVV